MFLFKNPFVSSPDVQINSSGQCYRTDLPYSVAASSLVIFHRKSSDKDCMVYKDNEDCGGAEWHDQSEVRGMYRKAITRH